MSEDDIVNEDEAVKFACADTNPELAKFVCPETDFSPDIMDDDIKK